LKDPTGGGSNGSTTSALKVKNPLKGSATLFPNPVSDVLQLKELQAYDNLRVIDQYGKVLNTQPIVEGETTKSLNVSQFANGLYLIQFTNKTGDVTTKKFQVIH
jgi:Secretion system C-terminal sorting domain